MFDLSEIYLGIMIGLNVKLQLLQFSPTHRLGCYGAEEIKSHPFFEGFDFDAALTAITESKSLN